MNAVGEQPTRPRVVDLAQYNRDICERIWGYSHFHPPERTPWWPVGSPLLDAPFCRWFPRLSVWITERVFLPIACRWKLDWQKGADWEHPAASAADASLVCRRR